MDKEQKKVLNGKALRKDVAHQLAQSLGQLKTTLGEKKFNNRVKKAAKLLTEGIEIKEQKVKAVKKTAQPEKAIKPAADAETPKAPRAVKRPAPVRKKTVAASKAS